MAPASFADSWRSIWHAFTSNDRHASFDSPYRTGQHVPLPQSRHAPLTSVATTAGESRIDLGISTDGNPPDGRPSSLNGRPMSPSPYSPGMRSEQRRVSSADRIRSVSVDKSPMTEIQMQSFSEGLPPPPPVSHSWKRIERWLEDNYQELFDNVCEPATANDVNELEHELDCTLPQDIRDSIQTHDGQERGGRPAGLLFGCMLLDCEEIVEEWSNWRAVNEQYLVNQTNGLGTPQIPIKAFAGPSSSSNTPVPVAQPAKSNGLWREELLGKQDSQPPNAVQKAYAHPSWIPLARDWGGNCLGVDLAPGPTGQWGQIIIFGRDYDCKYVVARSWGAFLASLADDLTAGTEKVVIEEESGDLRFLPFKKQAVEPPYLEVLRWRCDQRFGRRPPPRKRHSAPNSPGLRINPNVSGPPVDHLSSSSPYASPTGSERGRSPNRPNGKGPMVHSPMRPLVSSPLARVAEESSSSAPQPLVVRTDSDTLRSSVGGKSAHDKLISIDTPRPSGDFPSAARLVSTSSNKENVPPKGASTATPSQTRPEQSVVPSTAEMKNGGESATASGKSEVPMTNGNASATKNSSTELEDDMKDIAL